MMELEEAKKLLAALYRNGVEYVLIGSMGMAAQGLVRATRDMDFFVSSRRDNIEKLKNALKSVFDNDENIDLITHDDLAGDYPAIEYVPPHGRYHIDILTRLGENYRYEDIEWEEMEMDGFRVRIATPSMLYRMKRNSLRPRDQADAAWLNERFKIEVD